MVKHLNIEISGRVQGVGFRAYTRSLALELGVKGFVKNLQSGNVYAEAEAEEYVLDNFIKQLEKGNLWARVNEIKTIEGPVSHFHSFDISY